MALGTVATGQTSTTMQGVGRRAAGQFSYELTEIFTPAAGHEGRVQIHVEAHLAARRRPSPGHLGAE
jgi:hypothetical protein